MRSVILEVLSENDGKRKYKNNVVRTTLKMPTLNHLRSQK